MLEVGTNSYLPEKRKKNLQKYRDAPVIWLDNPAFFAGLWIRIGFGFSDFVDPDLY
jgi:hypothetical protein